MKITLSLTITRGKKRKPEAEAVQHDPQPEGNNFAQVESSGQHTTHHLDTDDRPGNYGGRISMRWNPPT